MRRLAALAGIAREPARSVSRRGLGRACLVSAVPPEGPTSIASRVEELQHPTSAREFWAAAQSMRRMVQDERDNAAIALDQRQLHRRQASCRPGYQTRAPHRYLFMHLAHDTRQRHARGAAACPRSTLSKAFCSCESSPASKNQGSWLTPQTHSGVSCDNEQPDLIKCMRSCAQDNGGRKNIEFHFWCLSSCVIIRADLGVPRGKW